jgi:hypothetical protein
VHIRHVKSLGWEEGNGALRHRLGGVVVPADDWKDFQQVDLEIAAHVVTGAVAIRVFAADACTLARRLLGAGVRVGAAHIAAQHQKYPAKTAARQPEGREGGL